MGCPVGSGVGRGVGIADGVDGAGVGDSVGIAVGRVGALVGTAVGRVGIAVGEMNMGTAVNRTPQKKFAASLENLQKKPFVDEMYAVAHSDPELE